MRWQVATRYLLTSIQIEIVLLITHAACCHREIDKTVSARSCVVMYVNVLDDTDAHYIYVLIYRFWILPKHKLASGISLYIARIRLIPSWKWYQRVKSQIDRLYLLRSYSSSFSVSLFPLLFLSQGAEALEGLRERKREEEEGRKIV